MPYERYDVSVVDKMDRVYIGFPVYNSTIPNLLQDKFFQDLAGKEVYIFATMAYSAGLSLTRAVKLAQEHNATVIGARAVIMPGSDGMSFLKKDSPQIAKMCNRDFNAIPEMDLIAADLAAIDKGDLVYRDREIVRLSSFIKGLYTVIFTLMSPIGKWLSKKLKADDHCTGCKLCEKICPTHNIIVSGKKVEFGNDCTLCLRCIHHCPAQAINIGNLTKGKFKYPGPGDSRFNPIDLVNKQDKN